MNQILKPTLFAITFLFLSSSHSALAQQLFLFGHFEVQIDYDLSPGDPDAGWDFSISYDSDNDFNDRDGITRNDPENLILYATQNTQFTIPSSLSRLGTPGDPFWILPFSNIQGTLFLGQRTIADQGLFQSSVGGTFRPSTLGNIILDMTEVTGSGPDNGGFFAIWEANSGSGNLEFHFDSSDGVDSNDHLEPVQIGGHTHYNWGMTQPGSYEVTFEASGKLNPQHGSDETSAQRTYTFVVPFSNTASSGSELRVGLTANGSPAAVFNANEQVEYATEQVALLTTSTVEGDTTLPYSFLMNIKTDQPTAANRIGLEPSLPIAFSGEFAAADKPYEISSIAGPGDLTIFNESNESVLLSFSEPGIYKVGFRAVGKHIADDSRATGETFMLTLLAGLEPDYSYSAWAESYEKTHALADGALANVDADFDNDGIINRAEFLLFWHGFDPVVADNTLIPTSDTPGTPAVFSMDSYKDDFSSTSANSTPRYSDIWATQNIPTGIFNLGQQMGNAYGRLLHVARLSEDILSTEKSVQSIEFAPIEDKSFAIGSFQLQATSSSGLPVQFEIIGPASLETGNMLVLEGSGSITVRAKQPGNDDYFAATAVENTFNVFDDQFTQAAQFFSSAGAPDEAGWVELESSLGWINVEHFPWFYHLTLGWLYASGDSIENAWLWNPQLNWLWTTDAIFPWCWRSDLSSWIYIRSDSSAQKFIYSPTSNDWSPF